MSTIKKDKNNAKNAYQPVKKSTITSKDDNAAKDKSAKGKPNKEVPSSPTTEVNPEG